MTYGSKNGANGSLKTSKTPRVGKGGSNLGSPISCGQPSHTFHDPVYKTTGSSKKSSDGRLVKISQPGINPKGSSRVG